MTRMIKLAKIKLLDDKTINKIAAGEVVERPVSVVKELVENAIDAYSSSITVEIKKGGISFIRITDNGLGIERDDLKSAFLRHSTSKITKVEDLGNILTLGFRGEALASIAAVSRVEMITKTRVAEMGQKIVLHGGEIREDQEIGTTNGTTIIIRDLFFNVPVRKGFLKSETAEAMAINDFVYRLAISNPHISFTYIRDGKTELKTPGRNDLKETIYSVMGNDFINSTFYIDYKKKDISINGYISNLKYFRGNRSHQFVFINGRTIKSELISKAVEEIYRERIPIGKFPIFILFLDIDPSCTDVNMHPSKMEVKFKDEKAVEKAVKEAVAEKLHSENLIPEVNLFENYLKKRFHEESLKTDDKADKKKETVKEIPVFEYIDNVKDYEEKAGTLNEDEVKNKMCSTTGIKMPEKLLDEKAIYRRGKEESGNIFVNEDSEKMIESSGKYESEIDKPNDEVDSTSSLSTELKLSEETVSVSESSLEQLDIGVESDEKSSDDRVSAKVYSHENIAENINVIGTIFNTYILCEDRINDEFLMIDQHAAHERVLYEELIENYKNRKIYTQEVLASMPIELSLNDMIKLEKNTELLTDLGFTYEEFGENTVRIKSIPVLFGNPGTEDLLLEILDVLDIDDKSTKSIYDSKLDRIMKQACTAAVKGGDRIANIEVKVLIERLFKSENPYTCPHGRPITIKSSRKEIEKSFARIQN